MAPVAKLNLLFPMTGNFSDQDILDIKQQQSLHITFFTTCESYNFS